MISDIRYLCIQLPYTEDTYYYLLYLLKYWIYIYFIILAPTSTHNSSNRDSINVYWNYCYIFIWQYYTTLKHYGCITIFCHSYCYWNSIYIINSHQQIVVIQYYSKIQNYNIKICIMFIILLLCLIYKERLIYFGQCEFLKKY